jgi:hypothetical protein
MTGLLSLVIRTYREEMQDHDHAVCSLLHNQQGQNKLDASHVPAHASGYGRQVR